MIEVGPKLATDRSKAATEGLRMSRASTGSTLDPKVLLGKMLDRCIRVAQISCYELDEGRVRPLDAARERLLSDLA
jgi:hypothetical protein